MIEGLKSWGRISFLKATNLTQRNTGHHCAERYLCNSRIPGEADSIFASSLPDSSQPITKGHNNDVKVDDHECRNSEQRDSYCLVLYFVLFAYNAQQYGRESIFFTFRRDGTNQQSTGARLREIWYGNRRQLYLHITTGHGSQQSHTWWRCKTLKLNPTNVT